MTKKGNPESGEYTLNNYEIYRTSIKPVRRIGVLILLLKKVGRRGGFMVSALVSGSSGPGSSPGRGHCVVFLGKTLYSHSVSLHPGV